MRSSIARSHDRRLPIARSHDRQITHSVRSPDHPIARSPDSVGSPILPLSLNALPVRRLYAAALLAAAAVALVAGAPAAQVPAAAAPYTVVSREGRRPLPVRVFNGQEMFALDDLVRLFDLSVREDALAGGLIITARTQTIVLSIGQGLASIGGRLISLPATPARDGRAWFVPVDFVPRALAPALGTPLDLRKPPRLVVVGDVRVPRVAGRIEPLDGVARLTLEVSPATPHTVVQDGARVVVKFDADGLDPALPASSVPDLIQAVRPGETPASLTVDLGPRFGSMRVSDLPGDRGSGRVVIDIIGQPTDGKPVPQAPAPTPDAPPLLDLSLIHI